MPVGSDALFVAIANRPVFSIYENVEMNLRLFASAPWHC